VKYQLFERGCSSLELICHGVQDPETDKLDDKEKYIYLRLAANLAI